MMEEFSDEKRSKVLFYITGSFKPPTEGFKNFRIKLLKTDDNIESLPIAHTCFLRIDFPEYSTKEILVKKVE